jgi:hypothetical protein
LLVEVAALVVFAPGLPVKVVQAVEPLVKLVVEIQDVGIALAVVVVPNLREVVHLALIILSQVHSVLVVQEKVGAMVAVEAAVAITAVAVQL